MPKPLLDTLRHFQGGLYIEVCADTLANVVKAVEETGKAGKVTMTFDVEKVGAAVSVLAKVTDKTPEKAPEKAPDADLFYATVEGNLSVDNPSQRKLDLRVAEAPAKPQVQVIENTPAPVNRVAQAAG